MGRLESVSFIFENAMGMVESLLTMGSLRICFLRLDSGITRKGTRRCDDGRGRCEDFGQRIEKKQLTTACALDGLFNSCIVITSSHSAQPIHSYSDLRKRSRAVESTHDPCDQ